MTTMKLTLKKKLRSLVGVVACNGSLAAWAVEEILELFLKEKTVVANECIAALDDIKNYDRILALLGMQEEGDPVAWVESHLAKGAQVPDGFIVVPVPNPEEMEALRSFAETAGDDESYTVSRELMSRLLLFGAVYRSTKRDWYYLTDFGRCLLAAAPMLSQRGEET